MGGNVFDNTAKIPRSFIEPTLSQFFNELTKIFPKHKSIFNTNTFNPIGSVGKKDFSGDIDLAVDVNVLITDRKYGKRFLTSWGIDKEKFQKSYENIKKRSKTSTDEMNNTRAFLVNLARNINDSNKIQAHEKKVTNGNIFTNFPQYNEQGEEQDVSVQIDFMIGNLEWLMFSYYSDEYKGNVKGLHRTQMLLSAFQQAGLSFNHINGVKDKETGEVLADTPTQALAVLGERFDFVLDDIVAKNYFKLHDFLKRNMKPNDYSGMINTYFTILDSTRTDIPDDLQNEWKKRRVELGLTGKFLPEDSNLQKELTCQV